VLFLSNGFSSYQRESLSAQYDDWTSFLEFRGITTFDYRTRGVSIR
jgi:hypothetical protein